MLKTNIADYAYTGQVIQDDEVERVLETQTDGVFWVSLKDGDFILATKHPETNMLCGIYSLTEMHPLGIGIVRVPKDDVGGRMLLPGEFLIAGDYAYVLENRTQAHTAEDDIINIGAYSAVLDTRVQSVVRNASKMVKGIAHFAYRTLYALRELYSASWKEEHQRQLRHWLSLSNSFHTKEEAGLLSIKLAEEVIDAKEEYESSKQG